MEALTRLVTESLARHGFDRPLDYRRLQWSRWFRCESPHSLLFVPSKPGVFAIAEEITDLATAPTHVPATNHVAADAACPEPSRIVRPPASNTASLPDHNLSRDGSLTNGDRSTPSREGHDFSRADRGGKDAASAAEGRRMLAVTQFFEDDDMAFVLDRMLSRQNPMQARLISGRYFVRFVVIEDQTQRRSICNALNQWIANSTEKATGIGSHFATSLELTPQTEYAANDAQRSLFESEDMAPAIPPANAGAIDARVETRASPVPRSEASGSGAERSFSAPTCTPTTPQPHPGAATNIHCPPFPSGF